MLKEKLRPMVDTKKPSMSGSSQPKPKPTAAPLTLPDRHQEPLPDRGQGPGDPLLGQWPERMQVPYGWTTEMPMPDQPDQQPDQSVSPVSVMSIHTNWGTEPTEFYQMNDDNDHQL